MGCHPVGLSCVTLFLMLFFLTTYNDGSSSLSVISSGTLPTRRAFGSVSLTGGLGSYNGPLLLDSVIGSIRCIGLRARSDVLINSVGRLGQARRCVFVCSHQRGRVVVFSGSKGFVHEVKHMKRNPKRVSGVRSFAAGSGEIFVCPLDHDDDFVVCSARGGSFVGRISLGCPISIGSGVSVVSSYLVCCPNVVCFPNGGRNFVDTYIVGASKRVMERRIPRVPIRTGGVSVTVSPSVS